MIFIDVQRRLKVTTLYVHCTSLSALYVHLLMKMFVFGPLIRVTRKEKNVSVEKINTVVQLSSFKYVTLNTYFVIFYVCLNVNSWLAICFYPGL